MHVITKPFELIRPDTSVRSTGTHISDIIKFMLLNIDEATYGKPITDATRALWEQGFLWEEVVSDTLARRYETRSSHTVLQEEICYRGIYGTPDAFLLDRWRLHEYKYTRISSARDITDPKFRHWLWQVKAYLKMLDASEADIYVWHAEGDYRENKRALGLVHSFEFSQREIDNNWNMLMGNLNRMMQELHDEDDIPF